MLTIEKTYPMSCPDLKYLETSPDRLTFFDIETTGFTGDYSAVYLIGCIFPSEDSWRMVQFFADSPQAQKDMLSAFSELISRRPVLVVGQSVCRIINRCRVGEKKEMINPIALGLLHEPPLSGTAVPVVGAVRLDVAVSASCGITDVRSVALFTAARA